MPKIKSGSAPLSDYQKFVLFLLSVLQFVLILDYMILAPLGDLLVKSLEINTRQFGVLVSSYIFSAAIAGFLVAGLIDRFDRKRILVIFFMGFIAGTSLCALANSYYTLLIGRIVAGIFGGLLSSVTLTIVSDLFLPEQRGRAMSAIQMTFAVSQIAGIPLGLFVASNFNWQYTFWIIVVLSLVILIVMLTKQKPISGHLVSHKKINPFVHIAEMVRNKNHQIGFASVIILAMGMMLQPFISIFLVNNLRVGYNELSLIFTATGCSSLLVMPLVGRLSDRFDKFEVFLGGTVAAIIIVPVYTNLPAVPVWFAMSMNILLFAAITGRMAPFQALNTMIPAPANRGAYMSLSASFQQMAVGLSVLIASRIAVQETPSSPLVNFDVLGNVVAGILLVSCFLVHRVSVLAKHNAEKAT